MTLPEQPNNQLFGLVLAGGKSVRMGRDKGEEIWFRKPQRYHMADQLALFCSQVFISCRAEQLGSSDAAYSYIVDSPLLSGPLAGIVTAMRTQPDAAWLVVACDLPLVNSTLLRQLISVRDMAAIATTFESPFDGLPEPLITIWEPAALPYLEEQIRLERKCPRKALLQTRTHICKAENPVLLMNVNTPEDARNAREYLTKSVSDEQQV